VLDARTDVDPARDGLALRLDVAGRVLLDVTTDAGHWRLPDRDAPGASWAQGEAMAPRSGGQPSAARSMVRANSTTECGSRAAPSPSTRASWATTVTDTAVSIEGRTTLGS
jgi:hypothetical protein